MPQAVPTRSGYKPPFPRINREFCSNYSMIATYGAYMFIIDHEDTTVDALVSGKDVA